MSVGSGDKRSVILLPSNVIMEQSLNMTLFSITDFFLANASDSENGICMTITMKRMIMSEMMTTYFPSLLLMMITYATTFFKPFFFEAALSVNLTTMLVMTTIFISKMEGLPPTSTTKMIDYWLIFCQLVPFTQVVLLTVMEYLRDEEHEKKERKEDCPDHKDDISEEGSEPDTKEAWNVPQKKRSKIDLVPNLMIIGRSHLMQVSTCLLYPSEKRVVPSAVLIVFVVYFGTAAIFYFE